MKEDEFKHKFKGFALKRSWRDVSKHWVEYIPEINPAGSGPEFPLNEFIGFTTIASELSYDQSVSAEVPGMRELIFREGLFLYYKAMCVLRSAEKDAQMGSLTWSLSTAYQASLFAAKSILYLMGIAFAEHNSKTVLIDIWPSEGTHKNKSIRLKSREDNSINFIKLNIKLEHRHIWLMFMRLINVAKFDSSLDELIGLFKKIEIPEFAKQRNIIQYHNQRWIYPDIHSGFIDGGFGQYTDLDNKLSYNEKSDFSFILAISLIKFANELFQDVISYSKKLTSEATLINMCKDSAIHPYSSLVFAV